MKQLLLFFLFELLLLTEAATIPRYTLSPGQAAPADTPEASQRLIFLLQYLATDYDRAVQHGQIADSLEYREMQRFAGDAVRIYHATKPTQRQTSNLLRQLEELIAERAPVAKIRKTCDATIAILITEKNLPVFPPRKPNLTYGKILFQENCVPCHGALGAGDGPSADTLNPKPRDFTAPERMNFYTPLQFYQAVTFGVEGTAMPSFSEALAPRQRWNLAFYLMTLRRDFQPVAPATPQKISVQELATKNNLELRAVLSSRDQLLHSDSASSFEQVVDFYRQNPPTLTMEEYLTTTEAALKRSLAAYQSSDSAGALQFAEEAYWEGFEPIEVDLPAPVLRKFEQTNAKYLACIEAKESPKQAQALVKTMLKILQEIRRQKR